MVVKSRLLEAGNHKMKSNGFVEHTLANGLRIVIEPMSHVQSVAAGFLARTGARDETPELAGVSHFAEHMCFKGTRKRGWREITLDFDNMGSMYNAYTSKERTFYYGWVPVENLEKQLELLGDMMRSAFPSEEFEMEKKVILEEIAMSDDQSDHRIYDLIHEHVYTGHPLSWPVLGTRDTITNLTRDQLFGYFQSRYHPGNLVMVVAGAVEPKVVIEMAERLCGDWQALAPRPDRVAPTTAQAGTFVTQTDRFNQQAIVLAYPAPSAEDDARETADVCAAVIGGHNSRFFWNIIQAGLSPHVAMGRIDYCDVGMMMSFGFCEPPNSERLLDAIRGEINKVITEGVREEEVQRVKNRTRTALATEAEAPFNRLTQLADDVDVLGHPRTVSERLAAVEKVSVIGIREYLEAWPMSGPGWLTSLGPRDWPKV